MSKIYAISTAFSAPVAGAVRSMEGLYAPKGTDASVRKYVTAPDGKRGIERRCHKRFQLNGIAFAMIRSTAAEPLQIRDKSMGSIGCAVYRSKPSRLGEIDNISTGGLTFHHVGRKSQFCKATVLDILLAEFGFYLAGIRYRIISDMAIPGDGPGGPVKMRQVRLQFQNLNRDQFSRLKDIILHHGAENVETVTKDENT